MSKERFENRKGKVESRISGNTKRVYQYMKTHSGITSMEAFEMFGATRLSVIIFNLRKYGCVIESEEKTGKNRYGDSVRFVEYKYIGE